MRSGTPVLALAAAGAIVSSAAPALANGRYPAGNQLVVAPANAALMVLSTTFGMLVSRDDGASWAWICESAIGYGTQGAENPAIAVTQGSTTLVATPEGLAVSSAGGCSWEVVDRDSFIDVAVRPARPRSALALASRPSPDDASSSASHLLASDDDGATWAPYGAPLPAYLEAQTVDVAASDDARVYVSGLHRTAGGTQGSLLVSTDDGLSWTEEVVPIDATTETDVLVAAVDPSNADRVYLRIANTFGARLLVTDDGGKTSRTVLTTYVPMYGFALSADGARVYVGDLDGLRVASASDLRFAMTWSRTVECLTWVGGVLYACSDDTSGGFFLGATANEGSTFAPVLHMAGIAGALRCPSDASAAACAAQWPSLDVELDPSAAGSQAQPQQDAGAALAGAPGDAPDRTPGASQCWCSAARSLPFTQDLSFAAPAALGVVYLARRARRRRLDRERV